MESKKMNYLRTAIKKRKFLIGFITSLIVAIGLFFFRYKAIFLFQYSRLQSIECDAHQTQRDCLRKVWVHRVNSLERYNELKESFSGFETDIVYNDSLRSFYVYHPPLTNAYQPITLDSFLSKTDYSSKRFWFDTRSVNSTNAVDAISTLQLIKNEETIKKTCIFELYDLEAAQLFHSKGYIVSLNVHPDTISLMLTDSGYYQSVTERLKNIEYVSQESTHIQSLKKIFPNKKIITWHLSFYDYFGMRKISELVNDKQVAILLVNIKTSGYR